MTTPATPDLTPDQLRALADQLQQQKPPEPSPEQQIAALTEQVAALTAAQTPEQPSEPPPPSTEQQIAALTEQVAALTAAQTPDDPLPQPDLDAPEAKYPTRATAGLPVDRGTTTGAATAHTVDALSAEYERLLAAGEVASTQIR